MLVSAPLDEELAAEQPKPKGGDPRLIELERLAAELHGEGIDFRVEHGRILQSAQDRDRDRETALTFDTDHIRLGIVSDTHGGSKFEQLTALRAFYREADEAEVHAFIHAGDMTQGPDEMHRGMVHEVHAHGADAQVDYVSRTYPRSGRDVPTYVISGNHDDSHLKQGGVNVVRRITQQRADLNYLGQDAAYLTLNGLRVYVTHPDGGGAYAKSYKGQKFAESLPVEKDVRLLLIGHYHNAVNFWERRTKVFQLACFQSQYAWLARKGLHPDIGGLILDIYYNDDGSLRRIDHSERRYEPMDNDWDFDVSREVSDGWSSRGLEVA
jgi:predicted phosphodiesterase